MNFCQQILHKGKHLRSGPSLKWNRISHEFLTSCGLHCDVNNHNYRIWANSNPREYTQKPLHSPKVTAWCGFTGSFIIGPFFETQCPVNGWRAETVNAQHYLTLLWETVCAMFNSTRSEKCHVHAGFHTANPVKAFLIQTFGEDRIVSSRCRYPWPPRSPDLTPADFWLWGYLKSRMYLSGPSSLSELIDAIHREVSSIHPDMLHSAIAGSSGVSSHLWWWSCGTYSGVNELEAPLSYATIKLKQPLMFNDKTRPFFDDENYLVGNRLRSWFRSLVESFMYYTELTYPGLLQVKISHSGPACTLKVLYNMVWISIDLVPVFSLDASHLQKYTLKNTINVSKESLLNCVLVPKPLKMELSSLLTSDSIERAWRIHFPETEKEILKDKHALKPIIKLMKDLRDKEMWPVPSYFIKVVAFWLVKENPHQHFWRDARLGLLFLKFLKAMEKHLEAKHLGHILYPKFNLFHSLSPRTLKNMQIRIHHIIANLEKHPIIAYKLFKVPILDHHLL
ncbi:cyclic GMP-AMP synthase [Trichonephila clavipes]|nr:cyclic GMP-AMP synthase [Trichonephila clavipes]